MSDRVERWLDALERRHLSDLTAPEVARALRALSSCYVERRAKLTDGAALDSRGKRAAFALFYGPLHFFVVRRLAALVAPDDALTRIVDLGCGTGAAGAAWALHADASVRGSDRNPWAVAEANRTYHDLGVDGRAVRADVSRVLTRPAPRTGILLAYVVNELDHASRTALLPRLLQARERGARVLVVEPISRAVAPWWRQWEVAFAAARGRADEWRFHEPLPQRQHALARAAGLDPRELTARTLWL